MMIVLGIDAAWTPSQPSAVALACETSSSWRLLTVCGSYADFTKHKDQPAQVTNGALPIQILSAAKRLCGAEVDLIAVDMPLSLSPIVGRRKCDDDVSRQYGSRGASTHSPSSERPGQLSDNMRFDFARAGYPLRTLLLETPALIEVYPHPALIELAAADRRLPYKIGRARSYWPNLDSNGRRAKLLSEWEKIVSLLDERIEGVRAALPPPDTLSTIRALKRYEDMLDAVVCAWVGVAAIQGQAIPLGDESSAIWIPNSQVRRK